MAARKSETTSSETAPNTDIGSRSASFIVAAGVSGAESHSLERFLAELTIGEQMAVVLVFHHREALDDGRFAATLAQHDRHLTQAVRGALVESGRIYWSALNTILTVEDGRFQIRDAQEPPGERGTIDSFLISVAQDREEKAIGIVFSGTNGVGTLGITALKEAGGLTLAEESPELSVEGIAPNHSPVAVADFVLPPEELAKRVQFHVSHAARYDEAAHLEAEAAEVSDPLAGGSFMRDEHVKHLETDLRVTRERLQATIEELTTVNGELAHGVQELGRSNSDLKNLLESTQIATIFLDNDLRVMNYTPAVTEIFQLVETDVGRPIGHIKSRIAYDELQDDARRVIRTLGSVDREIEDPATGTRTMVRVLPYRSIDNYIGGAVVTFMDVTPLTRAQQALRESEERFRAMAEQAEVGIAMTDRDGRAIYVNDRYCTILGLTREQIVGRAIQELTPIEAENRSDAMLERALSSGESFIGERRHRRPDGSIIWVRNNVSARRDVSGTVVGSLIIAIDMTVRVRAEEALRESEQHTKLLLAELQHRVRNTLAVVRSITRRTAANSNTVDDYAMHLEGRIEAFARTQTMATRSADSVIDLEELVRDELLAHAVRDDEKAHVEGPPVRLRTVVADKLGLAIHELATNAVKYGALSETGGHIDVTWTIEGGDGERTLKLEWRETGIRIATAAPRRRGFGTELIERSLPYEIDARTALEFSPGGIRCVIEFPLNQRTALLGRVQAPDGSDEDERPDERRSPP
ncbi:PAS domain S-box protein [Microvirga sp. Mcv34]|uniref:PAS domain S-box protein n=1 Tax=Microvirga sp. Mcv34 TaxID=2926016 RepID=UPI0021C7367B|nr:PAS domain S-box protein [Microvirga sp. Mcv34]